MVVIVGALLMLKSTGMLSSLNVRFVPHTAAVAAASVVICIGGLAFAFWARATIGRNWSGRVTLKEDHEVIERGPYRFVRHPIYSGLLLMIAGTALAVGDLSAVAGCS